MDEVKERFQRLIKDIGPSEIALLEQRLIDEGLPEEEITRLCDVHVSIFKDALDLQPEPEHIPGHPLHTFRAENEVIRKLSTEIRQLVQQLKDSERVTEEELDKWRQLHTQLLEIERHYSRKENILFPYLEKNGISGPPSVMWSIHDEIRGGLKEITRLLEAASPGESAELQQGIPSVVLPTLQAIDDMVYKENSILFPMAQETLTEDEWKEIFDQSDEIGYTQVTPSQEWRRREGAETRALKARAQHPEGALELPTGVLTLKQIELMLNHLPVDITFVDQHDTVRYFSQSAERIFPRTPAIIGRKVERCHPPESVHVVTQIVEDFRAGTRDTAEFWINMKGNLIYIRYFAVRDEQGEYQGVVEVTQNVTAIKQLEGEKRLLD